MRVGRVRRVANHEERTATKSRLPNRLSFVRVALFAFANHLAGVEYATTHQIGGIFRR
jgi:hypothetical protein